MWNLVNWDFYDFIESKKKDFLVMFYYSKQKCESCDKYVKYINSLKDELPSDFPLEFGKFDYF